MCPTDGNAANASALAAVSHSGGSCHGSGAPVASTFNQLQQTCGAACESEMWHQWKSGLDIPLETSVGEWHRADSGFPISK